MALFGTDGIRGLANGSVLTAETALAAAVAAAHILVESSSKNLRPVAIVGQDSRASGEFLEAAVIAGLASAGVDVYRVGILPTPAIAHLVAARGADLGVMISASHNAMPDNGIKLFARGGGKLDDAVEAAIEKRMGEPWERPTGRGVGRVFNDEKASAQYVDHLLASVSTPLKGLKIVVDCANGAASYVAPLVYQKAGAAVVAIHNSPDGWNINENCGSTHLENLIAQVKKAGADLGVAHDGDADRCLLVDHKGEVIDGDYILMILASALKAENKLNKKTVVGTVMSNLGFVNAMESDGIAVVKTAVGDRYVLENMLANDYSLGGEQSGHVILREFSNTGDGLLTALQVMQVLAKSKKSLSELASKMQKYPQVLINVKDVKREKLAASNKISNYIAEQEKNLGSNGRVLVRASGTESLIRVMVEAKEMQTAQKIAESIAELVRSELK